jgi:replicative DNA helicase
MQNELEQGMPASLDAERSVLGAVLLDPVIFGQAASLINFDDFSLDSHRRIFRAMDEMLDRGTGLDLMTLSEALARKKELESVGGVTYLSTLTEGLPRRDNIEHYVKIVRDKAMLRGIIHMSNSAIAQSFDQTEDVDDVLGNLQQRLLEIVYHGKKGSGVEVSEAAREAYDELSEIRNMEPRC